MLQAIIVQNPKWEPFNKVSDAFKAISPKDGESAVLVVRGRCKEKNKKNAVALASGKTAAWLKAKADVVIQKAPKSVKALAALVFLAFAVSASAQSDVTALAGGATLAAATTNTSAANGVIGMNIDQEAIFQLSCRGTNAAVTNAIVVSMDVSDNGRDWVANQYSITATPAGTTVGTSITRITNSVGGKYIRLNRTQNPNATYVTMGLTVSMKEN